MWYNLVMKLAIIDFNGTLYNPNTNGLMDGAKPLLDGLQERGIDMDLVSRQMLGYEGDELERIGIKDYFSEVLFVMEKTGKQFLDIIKKHGATPQETLVIGDHPLSEIKAGNDVGAHTILLRHPQISEDMVRKAGANCVVDNLEDVLALV